MAEACPSSGTGTGTGPGSRRHDRLGPELAGFERVGLEAALKVDLMSRLDTKIALGRGALGQVLCRLQGCAERDRLQLVETAVGVAPLYSTLYFDTEDFQLYRAHHNGRRVRQKYRYRHYHSTGAVFFEVKRRRNGRRTVKDRVPVEGMRPRLGSDELALAAGLGLRPAPMIPMLEVTYRRLTLIGSSQRITIDLDLRCCGRNRQAVDFSPAAVLEIKQARRQPDSAISVALRELGLRPHSMSKYCLGVASCFEQVKSHRFRDRLRKMEAIS